MSHPPIGLHVPARARRAPHGKLYESHSNSVFGARAFFQVGGLKPAHDNQYGFAVEAPVWRGAFITLDTNQQKTRGMVNGNVLVPLPSERTPLATDPALRAFVLLILNAYPDQIPNRTDIDPRMLNTNSPQRVNGQVWNTHFDQQLGGRDRLMFQYGYLGQKVIAFQLVAGQNPDTTGVANDGRVTWQREWTPATSTRATVAFDRTTSLLAPSRDNLGPSINVDGTPWDRPNLVDLAVLGRTIGNPDTSRRLLPASAFAYITPGMTAGNLGRNTFRKGPIRNFNASLSRRFPVWREKPLTIRAESINLFNTAQFAAPDYMLTDSSFGTITNTLNNGRSLRLGAGFEF